MDDPRKAYWIMALLALFGPAAFLAHVLRLAVVKVTLVPGVGIVFRGRTLPFCEIRSVEERGWSPRFDVEAIRWPLDGIRAAGELLRSPSLVKPLAILVILVLMVAFLALLVLAGVLFPAFVLLSPFQHRVIVEGSSGQEWTFRGLGDGARFAREIRRGIAGPP